MREKMSEEEFLKEAKKKVWIEEDVVRFLIRKRNERRKGLQSRSFKSP